MKTRNLILGAHYNLVDSFYIYLTELLAGCYRMVNNVGRFSPVSERAWHWEDLVLNVGHCLGSAAASRSSFLSLENR